MFHENLVALSEITYWHGLSVDSMRKALKRHDIEVFDVMGSKHIHREDAARLIELEAQPTDGYEK